MLRPRGGHKFHEDAILGNISAHWSVLPAHSAAVIARIRALRRIERDHYRCGRVGAKSMRELHPPTTRNEPVHLKHILVRLDLHEQIVRSETL